MRRSHILTANKRTQQQRGRCRRSNEVERKSRAEPKLDRPLVGDDIEPWAFTAYEPRSIDLTRLTVPEQHSLSAADWLRGIREDGSWWGRVRLTIEWPPLRPYTPRIVRKEVMGAHYQLPSPPELPHSSDRERVRAMINSGLARAVKELRHERGIDVTRLADDAQLYLWQLTAVEEARLQIVPFALLYRLAQGLNISMSELLSRIEATYEER